MKKKIVALGDIKLALFVRTKLNQDHVLYLAELITNKVELSPIQITPDNELIDGRHRYEAYGLCNFTDLECEVIEVSGESERIAAAYKANIGGSLPPSRQDIEHTVMLLLERGENRKRITELLNMPTGMARGYVNEVQSRLARVKLQRAAADVADGNLKVTEAAEKHGVDLQKLKDVISGNRRRNRIEVTEVHRQLTVTFKSFGSKNAALLAKVLDIYRDGDMTAKQSKEILDHVEDLQRKASRAIRGWKKRFTAQTGSE